MAAAPPPWEGRLYVAVVLLTIAFTSATTLLTLHTALPPPTLPASVLHAILTLLSLSAYLVAHFTPPGTTADWSAARPDLLHPLASPHTLPPPFASRRCDVCHAPKPARVHHCTACNRCILRFDHHCPWLATCIGLYNLKPFLLFLLYTAMLAVHTALHLARALSLHFPHRTRSRPLPLLTAMFAPISFALALVAAVGLTALLVWNLSLVARNRTTLENLRSLTPGQPIINYDAGTLANFRHALGWNPLFWLLPIPQPRTPPSPQKP